MALDSNTHVTDNTYAIKYYWQGVNRKGETINLYIYAKGYKGAPLVYEICDLVSLKLNIMGDQGGVDVPIVKTSLQMTLVDSYDAPVKEIGYKYFDGVQKYVYEKHGGWEEFFTPDSTKYIIQVRMTPNPESEYSESRLIWQGYVTPDSWHESLSYRGSVTIVARDNLGHLADFDFDMAGDNTWGLLRVGDIIDQALTKIKFPLRYYFAGENDYRAGLYAVGANTSNDLGFRDLRVNASAFEGMTWWDALEDIFDSIGCAFRFTDYNAFTLMPLRHMPDMGWAEDEWKTLNPGMEFYGGSRMLDPGYKEIVEKIDFGQTDKLEYQMADVKGPTYGTSHNESFVLEFKNDHVVDPYGQTSSRSSAIQRSMPSYTDTSGIGKIGNLSYLKGSIDPNVYELQDYTKETEGEGFRNYLFIAANRGSISYNSQNYSVNYVDDYPLMFLARVKSTGFKLKMEFASPAGFDDSGKLGAYPFKLWKVRYRIQYGRAFGGDSYSWANGNWVQVSGNGFIIEKTYDPETEDVTTIEEDLIPCEAVGEYGYLWVTIVSMVYRTTTYWWTYNGRLVLNIQMSNGVYARLKSISLESALTKKMVSDTTKTVNNEDYNVRCTRNPRFGCLSQDVGFVYPSNYPYAFFYMDTNNLPQLAPYLWKWSDRSTRLGLPVQIALQILQYHATPLEVLEGSTAMVSKVNRFTFDDNYYYKGLAHILLSGVYDFMQAKFDSAILRAFARFSNVSTRSYAAPGVEGSGSVPEVAPEDVRTVRVSAVALEREEGVQQVEIAETVAEETEVQESSGPVSYLTPTIEAGQLVQFEEGMTIERHFVAREVNEEINP